PSPWTSSSSGQPWTVSNDRFLRTPSGAGGTRQALRDRLPEHVEVSPPGIPRGNAATVALVAVGTALGAEAGAVVAAQGRHRQLEHEGVAHQRAEVDVVVDDRVELLVGGCGQRVVGETLVHVDLQVARDGFGAAATGPDPRG